MSQWQPTASMETLKQRAAILSQIRAFFSERQVLEVETPVMSNGTVTDVHLHAFSTQFISPLTPDNKLLYLQTSPEYAMKRLLCAGSGPIFQITKAFRNEEAGRNHNPEFSMLEWYRPGFDHHQLMDEMDAFLQHILQCEAASRITYQQAFEVHLNIDPLTADLQQLIDCCLANGLDTFAESETDIDTLLQLLFCECIEPKIGQETPAMVFDFPASQAALARLDAKDPRVANRFEVYFKTIELANGFYELADPQEQADRFADDNRKRQSMGLPSLPVDNFFLEGLRHGLPDCSGVALGIDRLVMLALDKSRIQDVLAFSVDNA